MLECITKLFTNNMATKEQSKKEEKRTFRREAKKLKAKEKNTF